MTTVKQTGSMYEIVGLSTEEKPMTVGVGSLFLELDTGKMYYFDGTWKEYQG